LAESLYNKDGTPNNEAQRFALLGCDHLKFGLDHYLCNFEKEHNVKVIRHEFIDDDFHNIFNKNIKK
jgi:hypothetical protein